MFYFIEGIAFLAIFYISVYNNKDIKSKMVIQLIAKDKQEKFQFQGRCKLIIDSLSKLLLVEPFIEDFKMISAMFKWEFVAQKNILLVFAEYDFQDFALIFDNPGKCKKAMGFLLKKGATAGKKELISQRFLPSIFEEISANNVSNLKMKEILLKWIEFFEGKEKEEFIQILKDYNVYDLFYSNNVGELQKNPRKRKAKDVIYGKESKIGNTSKRFNNENFKKRCSNKQNTHVLSKIIEAPNFEILKYIQNGHSRIKLSIFPDSNDRKYCYEYFWLKSMSCYICCSCHNNGKTLNAKIIKRNGKDVVQLNETQHVCKLREYKTIIEKPNYEILSYEYNGSVSERLIIFLDSSQKFCYEYYCTKQTKVYVCCGCIRKKFYVQADVCQKEDGTEFILSKFKNHVCEPRKFNPIKYGKKEIVEGDNFKIFKLFQNEIDQSEMVIFTSSDQSKCFEYSWNNIRKKFICQRCHTKTKYVAAELCQKRDGTQYLKLNKTKHVCEPREYDPDKFDPSKKEIIESSNFKIYNYKHNGNQKSKLIIFCETNKNLCYEYYCNKQHQKYYCSYCPMENRPFAFVCQNEDSKDYLIHSNSEHICDLHEFDRDKYKDDNIVRKEMYDLTSTTIGKVKNQILIIFTSQEKNFYHKFLYYPKMKYFYCSKCYYSSKIRITATLQNEGSENEFVYVSNQKHICEPFESLTDVNVVKSPNFQFIKRKLNGRIVQKIVVFTNEAQSKCYEYSWHESNKIFICYTCQKHHKIYVFVKTFKNNANKECIKLCEKPHKCKPIKFLPENISSKIVKQPDFKLYETIFRGKSYRRLAIYDSKNRNMGYIFSYSEKFKKYVCSRCKNKKTFVTAKVLQNENAENCLELNDNEHVCELQKI